MMWYKAFSIYLVLRRGINVLFQVTALVFFSKMRLPVSVRFGSYSYSLTYIPSIYPISLFCIKDVDLVWFRDPMQYFHDYRAAAHNRSVQTGSFVDAFFSDDGQRSMRVRFFCFYPFACLVYVVIEHIVILQRWVVVFSFRFVLFLFSFSFSHRNALSSIFSFYLFIRLFSTSQYTPFYANSGFYYLVSNEKSTYFAWSIMAAMDAIQVSTYVPSS